jgi:hypothetical protein
MQAVPLDRVGEEFKIYELQLSGVPGRATGSDEGSDVEEILASGHVGTYVVPGTSRSPGVKQPLGRYEVRWGERWTRSDPVRGVDRDTGSSIVILDAYGSQFRRAERDQYRQPVFPSLSGEANVTLDPYGGVRQVPESEYIVVREI